MRTIQVLPGITQHNVTTDRLEIAYLEAGTGSIPLVLVHGNCSSSHFFQEFMLALTATGRYTIYAPDLRGFGDSEPLPVDATRGVRDFSDDLDSLAGELGLNSFHVLGWSLGGNIVMQYVLDHPGRVRSLTLHASGSPFGFGGTRDAEGTATWPDFAGSGAGTTNPDFVQRLAHGDRSNDPSSPRTIMNHFYFKPSFQPAADREEMYLASLLSTRVQPGNYPGDMTPSPHWPHVAPGAHGVNNAMSPKYLNQANFATISHKPPVLWVHGADDQIVSDTSLFDVGFLGQIGAVAGWPGAPIYPPQPMKTQLRTVLQTYKSNGGQYQEVQLADCGHAPLIEQQGSVCELVDSFIMNHSG